jgi:hypothetical protein
MGYIAGYIAEIVVNGTTINPDTSSATYALTRDAMNRTKLGSDRATYIVGLGDATLDAQLHLNTDTAVTLNTAYESTVPVTFIFRPGALGINDAGQYSGEAIITDYSMAGDADGEWDVSLTAQATGAFVYTPPA